MKEKMFISTTYVDYITNTPMNIEPARNGGENP